jgi:hypothetical protein
MIQLQPKDLDYMFTAMGGRKNPVKAAGSLLGFSGGELDAGVPTWAWVIVGVGAGIYLGKIASQKGLI